jgi:hypothetical protein
MRAGADDEERDRDPLGLDLLDGQVSWSLGLPGRVEVSGNVVLSRVTSMPERPTLPPPPLDVVVVAPARDPVRPFYALYGPVPYANKSGPDRFDAWQHGDARLALKHRLSGPRGLRPGWAVGLEATLPLTRRLADLQAGSGSGSVDLGGRLIAEWRRGSMSAVTSLLYTRTGGPPFEDRIIRVSGSEVRAERQGLELPDRLEAGIGLRRTLGPRFSALLEASGTWEVGARTPTLDRAVPLDVLAGAQWRRGRTGVLAALRYHGHALPSGERRPSPLAGLIDVSRLDERALQALLSSSGAGAALPALRPGTQRVLALATPPLALPEGARVIPADYVIRSEHQMGFVLAWGFSF